MWQIIPILLLCNPLNEPIDIGSVVELPPSIGYGINQTDYEYRVGWVHHNGFSVIKQFHEKKLSGAFVVYSTVKLKPGQNLYHSGQYVFIKIGDGVYYNRILHILYPIDRKSLDKAEEMVEKYREEIRGFYGGL
uniref:Uncharacterized protein n=1 Tax=viral metagenome TaxID=1070528 RepID=A0A6M3IKP4_9ZZZZ